MSHSITFEPSNTCVDIRDNEPVLDAGLRQGLNLAYGCRNGACGACKSQLLEGSVSYHGTETPALSEQEHRDGYILPCVAHPTSDLRVKVKELSSLEELTPRTLPSRVEHMERLCHDVMGLSLRLPRSERMRFLAGQYIEILMEDGKRRAFSLANAPHDDEFLQLHIRHYDGGVFSEKVFSEMQEKALLRIHGPLGNFFLREESERPMIFVAGGTGFAPIKGIIEHALAEGVERPMHLYWGVQACRDLYMHDLAERWAAEHPHISYTPVLSKSDPADNWQGRTGFVHEAVMQDYEDFSTYEVYASGPPVMVYAVRDELLKSGLDTDHIHSDAFEFSKDR